jgi:hypothetical protein
LELDWSKLLRENAEARRLIKAFAKIKNERVRREVVKLADRIAGIEPTPRKRRRKGY